MTPMSKKARLLSMLEFIEMKIINYAEMWTLIKLSRLLLQLLLFREESVL